MITPVANFLNLAATELQIPAAGDVLSGDDAALGLLLLNELFDAWNIDERASFASQFLTFTLTPNLQPHTIGLSTNTPTPTFAVSTNRPPRILGAALILNTSTPAVNNPINIRDRQWWLENRIPSLSAAIPTDLYYEPAWPNGKINLWVVPTANYQILLETMTPLSQLAATDSVNLPPGYSQAVRLTLAENWAAAMGVQAPPTLTLRAAAARADVFGMNDEIPRLGNDAHFGSPSQRGNWNYRIGRVM